GSGHRARGRRQRGVQGTGSRYRRGLDVQPPIAEKLRLVSAARPGPVRIGVAFGSSYTLPRLASNTRRRPDLPLVSRRASATAPAAAVSWASRTERTPTLWSQARYPAAVSPRLFRPRFSPFS